MAIANSDGSIILSTKVDESGLKAWFASVNSSVKTAKANIAGIGTQATASAKTVKTAIASVGTALKALLPMLIGIQTIIKAIDFSKEAGQLATQTEASVQRLIDIYGSASDSVGDFIDTNARALGMSKAAASSFSSVYGNLFSVWADQATNAELTNRYLNMTAVVASKTGRSVEDVQERVRSGLLGNTEAIEDLGIFVNVKTIEMTDAFRRMADGKSWEQLDAYTQQQIRSMAILEQATAKYGDEVADTSATTRNRFNAAYQDFQNSWGNIVNTVLLPVLETLTQIFDIATKGLNVLSGRSGQILENVELQEENTDKTAENIEEQTKNQKELNKELKKATASFDDIEIISAKTAENTSGGLDSGLQGVGGDLGGNAPDGSAYVEEIDETLTAIMGIVALSLAAVGLILLFTGHIGWGIGFIIAGAATLTVTMASASEFGYDGIIQMLTTIMGVAGGALLALGIILLWIGGVVGTPVAIGMIIAGGALIVSAVAAQAAFAPDDIAAWLSLIMGIAGGALLALGIILCMIGSTPLGVGMIIAGSVALVSAVALNFDVVKDQITGWVAVIMGIVGAAALVLGIVLTASGAHLALGIALIAVGAVALVTPIALNWNVLVEKLKGTIGLITALVGAAVLVLGIILTCTGNFALGIPLLVAGAAGLVTVVAINWDAIIEALRGTIGTITAIVSGALLVLGIILVCTGVALVLGIALIAVGAVGLVTTVALNWNRIVNNIKTFLFKNPVLISLISGGLLILGIILICTGVAFVLGIALVAVGAVGLVTTVALNWNRIVNNIKDFLFKNPLLISLISGGLLILGIILVCTGVALVLGIALIAVGAVGLVTTVALNWNWIVNNIKTFLFEHPVLASLISGGLLILGIILCVTGVMLPLGIALIAAGAAGLVSVVAINKDSIVGWIKGVWEAIKGFWNKYIAPIFTLAFWLDLAKTCGNGLITGFELAINGIINLFESMVNFVIDGINLLITGVDTIVGVIGDIFGADWNVPKIPNVDFGEVEIPRLAKGAVIPPNREFLAVLDDQKHGTNIEAPLQTIVDAFNIALSQNGYNQNNGNTEVVLEIDGREFGRAVVEQGNRENRRIGTRLVIV